MSWKRTMFVAIVAAMAVGCADDMGGDAQQSQQYQTVEQSLWSGCSASSASSDCASDVTKFKGKYPCADWISAPYCNSKWTCALTAQFDLNCENGGGECSSDSQCSYYTSQGYKGICQNYYCQQKWVGYSGPCDDGDPCTTSDKYSSSGACYGTAMNCGAGKYCSAGSCYYKSGGSCNDGNSCTTNDKYDSWGGCSGTQINCGYGYYCSSGSCYYSGGGSCDDGNACTYNDKYTSSGYCQGTAMSCGSGQYCSGGYCYYSQTSSTNKCFNLYLQNLGTTFSYMTVGGIGCSKYVTNWDGSLDFGASGCGSWNDSIRTESMSSMGYAGSMTLKASSSVKYFIHVIKLDGIHYVDSPNGPTQWWKGDLSYQTSSGSSLSRWYVKGSGGGGLVVTDLSTMSTNCN